jgi:ribosomal protein L3
VSTNDIGLVGQRGGMTATACAELVALDVLRAANGATVDGHAVRRHIDGLRAAEHGTVDEQLAAAAARAQVVHVLRVCQAWQGGVAKTRRRGRA